MKTLVAGSHGYAGGKRLVVQSSGSRGEDALNSFSEGSQVERLDNGIATGSASDDLFRVEKHGNDEPCIEALDLPSEGAQRQAPTRL